MKKLRLSKNAWGSCTFFQLGDGVRYVVTSLYEDLQNLCRRVFLDALITDSYLCPFVSCLSPCVLAVGVNCDPVVSPHAFGAVSTKASPAQAELRRR